MTVEEAINMAGGFYELASKKFSMIDQGKLVNGAKKLIA